MSVKKQTPNFANFNILRRIPDEFLDEADVDSHIQHNAFDISQSQHRILRVSKDSKDKSFAIKLFEFCDITTQQRYVLQKETKISKRELTPLVDSLRDFLKAFDHASKCVRIPLPKHKADIGPTKSKVKLFTHIYEDIFAQF